MKISSSTQLKDYCLRALGSPVINIEVDDSQLNDRIDDAVQFFIERHYDGVEEVYYKKTISYKDEINGFVELDDNIVAVIEMMNRDDTSSIEVMDDLDFQFMMNYNEDDGFNSGDLTDYYINRSYLNLMETILSNVKYRHIEFNKATNKFYPQAGLEYRASGNLLPNISSVDAPWVTLNSTIGLYDTEIPNGDLDGSSITSLSAGTFGISNTKVTDWYVRGTYTASVRLKGGSYASDVILSIKDRNGSVVATETVTPPTNKWETFYIEATYSDSNINDLTLSIESDSEAVGAGETFYVWTPQLYRNNFIVVRGYRAIDPMDDFDIYDDPWMKKYTIALFKKQWGQNLSKFDQIQLPSGITLNGNELKREGIDEIKELLIEFSQRYEAPDLFFLG